MSQCAPGSDFVLLAAAIAIIISSDLSVDNINILSNIFNAIGDNLAIIAGKKELRPINGLNATD